MGQPPRLARAAASARLALQTRIGEPELALLPLLVDPDRVAIDVGASVGVYTSALVRLSSRVVAFEPVPPLSRRLVHTFPDVLVLPLAASDETGMQALHVPRREGKDLHPRASLRADADPDLEHDQILVPTCRLDSLDLGPVGFIKVDVEGHELAVMRGTRGLLERDRPILLVESEIRHGDGPAALGSVMGEMGYDGCFIHQGRLQELDAFRPDMQWVPPVQLGTRGRRINQLKWLVKPSTALARRLVNNFIFVPSEQQSARMDRLRQALAADA